MYREAATMKSIALALVLFTGLARADEVTDRVAIVKTINGLNVFPMPAALFTADFDGMAEIVRLRTAYFPVVCPEVWGELCSAKSIPIKVDEKPGELIISKEPWGEAIWVPATSMPITPKKIRFLTSDVAMVDAVGNAPLFIVLRRQGADWKIASLRILAEK